MCNPHPLYPPPLRHNVIPGAPKSQRVMCYMYPHPLYPPPLRRITGVLSPMRQRHSPHTSPRSGLSPSRQRHLTSTMETPYHTVVKSSVPYMAVTSPSPPVTFPLIGHLQSQASHLCDTQTPPQVVKCNSLWQLKARMHPRGSDRIMMMERRLVRRLLRKVATKEKGARVAQMR